LGNKAENEAAKESIKTYTITVHAMKSALANIGEGALSGEAAKLEAAGRAADTALILAESDAFLNQLGAIIKRLSPTEEAQTKGAAFFSQLSAENRRTLREAAENYDTQVVQELAATLDDGERQFIADCLLHSDFERLIEALA
jgi:hypothetical protein